MDEDDTLEEPEVEGDEFQYGDTPAMDTSPAGLVDSSAGHDYPFGLSEMQIVRIIYFYGSRRSVAKAAKKKLAPLSEMSRTELKILKEFCEWFGLDWQFNDDYWKAYKMLNMKFKAICSFLKHRPGYVTTQIYRAFKECGYVNVIQSIVWVLNENKQLVPKIAKVMDAHASSKMVPVARMEQTLWNIQNTSLDKMQMILESITLNDIKKANLGMKSKAFRDIFAAYHMARIQNKTPNQALINLEIHTAEPTEKLNVFAAYLNKNREQS